MALTMAALTPGLSEIYDSILSRVPAGSKTVVYLEAGHYSGATGPDEFSRSTQLHALDLGRNLVLNYQKQTKIVFGILKDDLGLTCDAVSCYIPRAEDADESELSIPRELVALLETDPLVKMDKLLLFSERNAKNRGLAFLKKAREKGFPDGMSLKTRDGQEVVVYSTYDRHEVVLAEVHGNHWTAKCPVLMGQHYADVLRRLSQRFPAEYPVIVVDFSDLLDRNKVGRGSEAALRFFARHTAPVTLLNVFYDDPQGEGFIVDEYCSEDF